MWQLFLNASSQQIDEYIVALLREVLVSRCAKHKLSTSLCASEFMSILASADGRDPVRLAAVSTHAITQCLTESVGFFRSLAAPFLLQTFIVILVQVHLGFIPELGKLFFLMFSQFVFCIYVCEGAS